MRFLAFVETLHAMAEANLNGAALFDVAGKSKDPARILEYVDLRSQVDGVKPRLRPEEVPKALHHVRQGQDVGVEVTVVELPARCRSAAPAGHLPRLGAAEVLELSL